MLDIYKNGFYNDNVTDCKGGSPILKSERKQVILETVNRDGVVSLDHLSQLLSSSESTIRRDLDELEAKGQLKRVHGGAESLSRLREEESIEQKAIKQVKEKEKIAQKAASYVQDGEIIFIDAGTTTQLLIDALPQLNIRVVTNSIHHAAKLVDRGFETIVIGGLVKAITDASVGGVALNQIGNLNFDKAFIGMNGVDEDYITTPEMEEGAVKRAILDNASKTFVLADKSKLGQTSFVKVAPIKRVSIITNQVENELLSKLKGKTEVIEV